MCLTPRSNRRPFAESLYRPQSITKECSWHYSSSGVNLGRSIGSDGRAHRGGGPEPTARMVRATVSVMLVPGSAPVKGYTAGGRPGGYVAASNRGSLPGPVVRAFGSHRKRAP